MVHYFSQSGSAFVGRSTTAAAPDRLEKVTRVVDQLRSLPFDVDVRVYGLPEASLVDVDVDLTGVADPRHLVYAALESMVEAVDGFDYMLCIEDDILIDADAVERMIRFAESARVNEILLPNRIEVGELGVTYCVDLLASGGWRPLHRRFEGVKLGVANNPHSGLAFLSRSQAKYASRRVDLGRREQYVGGYMASAFANIHEPFLMWRTTDLDAHHVVHLDRWKADTVINTREPVERQRITGDGLAGSLDEISVEGAQVSIRGWAADALGKPLSLDGIELGGVAVPGAAPEPQARPDVAAALPHVSEEVGFVVRFALADLTAQQRTAKRFALKIGHGRLSGAWPRRTAVWAANPLVVPRRPADLWRRK